MNVRKQQGGWAASFIIIGAVLIVGLVGGTYYVKRQSVSTPDRPSVNPPKVASSEPSEQKNNADKSSPTKPSESPSQDASRTTPANSSPEITSAQLPQTGAADSISRSVAVTLLTVSVAMYLQSRRKMSSL